MDEEAIAQLEAECPAVDFEVWPENWEALRAFLFVSGQWRTASIGGGLEPARVYWQGLDYAAVAAGLAGGGFTVSPALWDDLRVMEGAARNALNGIVEHDE